MLFEMKCPSCGATMQFDDSRDSMFCPYCGNRVANIAGKIDIIFSLYLPRLFSDFSVKTTNYTTYQQASVVVVADDS